jgi:hypothetical protein
VATRFSASMAGMVQEGGRICGYCRPWWWQYQQCGAVASHDRTSIAVAVAAPGNKHSQPITPTSARIAHCHGRRPGPAARL